jgi:hypothetical protein
MRIEREEFLLHSADDVYPLVRDRLPELLPHLPGIESIEVLSRTAVAKGKTRVKSRWRIRPPALLGRLLPAAAFVWEEDAVWIDKSYRVDSTIHGYGYESRGKTWYEPASDWTRVRIEVDVSFRPHSVDIPPENLEKIAVAAEQALREALEPNLAALLDAIRERLSD